MAGGGAVGERTVKETPTWALAAVCAIFVIISIIIEYCIHSLEKWFKKKHKKAMLEALDKIKAELMLLGFISLMLTVGSSWVSRICISAKAGGLMLPCRQEKNNSDNEVKDDKRRLLWYESERHQMWHRLLAAAASGGDTNHCSSNGDMVPLITQTAMNQLHIFIFVLAVFHVIYSIITMALGQAKMKKWKKWESDTDSLEYQFSNDPSRFRLTHQTSFVKRHIGLSSTPVIRYIVAFFRQFFSSVTKVDYLTMRHGFITAHLSPNSKFNFHKYIKRSLEDDFKVVVGISYPLWVFAVLFLLLNVYGWYSLFWISFVPLVILFLVGMKLEMIIMDMAQQIQDKNAVIKGAPTVEPSNKLFWFNRPQWILLLIHFTLFENAFQMAYFLWIWYEYGLKPCFHDDLPMILVRVLIGVVVQILCSYSTFPLYALVTQMGSHMKKAIFEEQTANALKRWQKGAKERNRLRKAGMDHISSTTQSGENTPSQGASPLHLLHKSKFRSDMIGSPRSYPSSPVSYPGSPISYQSDIDEIIDMESNNHHQVALQIGHASTRDDDTNNSAEFSFARS